MEEKKSFPYATRGEYFGIFVGSVKIQFLPQDWMSFF